MNIKEHIFSLRHFILQKHLFADLLQKNMFLNTDVVESFFDKVPGIQSCNFIRKEDDTAVFL